MYSNIKKDIARPDLAFVNQESPLGGDDIPYSDLNDSIHQVK